MRLARMEFEHTARCPVSHGEQERQWARAPSLGETMDIESMRPPFYWSCEGVVGRISPEGDRSPERSCSD